MKIIKVIKIIVLLLLFILTLALGSKNHQMVTFDYLIAKSDLSMSSLLGLTFLFAFAIASILFSTSYFKSKWTIIRLNKKLTNVQAKLDEEFGIKVKKEAVKPYAKSELLDNSEHAIKVGSNPALSPSDKKH